MTQFVIAGPIANDTQLWWHNELGWIEDLIEATTLPVDILTTPLPPGATGVLEITMDGSYVCFYTLLPGVGGEGLLPT